MAGATRNGARNRARFLFPFLLLTPPLAAFAEEYSFLNLHASQTSVPSLRVPFLKPPSGDSLQHHKLEMEDYRARLARRPKVTREVWNVRANDPKGVTMTVIHDLVEGGRVRFDFSSKVAGRRRTDLLLPRGPELGPVSLLINGTEAGSADPWSEEREPAAWMALPAEVEIRAGTNTLEVVQQSPQDLAIWLDAFRLSPVVGDSKER